MNAPARLPGTAGPAPTRLERAEGRARLSFKRRGAATVLDDMFQSGSAKVRLPRAEPDRPAEAILINTAGGLTDGDLMEAEIGWGEGTEAVVTTQAAERIYRSRGTPARVVNRLDVGAGARAAWLPQETILFDRGRLARRTEAHVAEGGALVAGESLILGRTAMGETVREGAIADSWRIRVGGRLVFADGFAVDGPIVETFRRPGVAAGGAALATLVVIGEGAEALAAPFRETIDGETDIVGGASFMKPVLVARLVAPEGRALKRAAGRLIGIAMNAQGTAAFRPPRSWLC